MISVFRKDRLLGSASLIAYLAVAAPCTSRAGDILPTNGSVAAGSATIGAPANGALTVQQQSGRAVLDWGSFSVGAGNSVRFVQPDASSATLNRVTGSTTSTIAGSLTSNGSVFLINPNGIQITPTGTVSVARGFAASTLDISDEDFMAGKTTFLGTGTPASVSNAGTITTASGGFVALLGGMVDNSGLISAPIGKIGLGSGEQATLDFTGDQFLQVAVPANATDADGTPLISNSGKINARGGQVVLTAATARNSVRDAINIPGSIQASSISGQNGAIVLSGGDGGNVTVSGQLKSASGGIAVSGNSIALTKARVSVASKKKTGGTVRVTAVTSVDLTGATIDASGTTGGTVLIGGGPTGLGALAHAQSVTMDATSTITANGIGNGNGGQIVLWSDGLTQAHGMMTAEGGSISGNGGTIETSGESVDFTGLRVDTSAAAGTTGLWLTDPYDLTIGSGDAATIASNLATTNVTLKTTANSTTGPGIANSAGAGDITIGSAITWSSGNTLTLDAYHGIAITAPITVSGNGGVILTTNDGGTGGTLGFGLGSSGYSGSLSYTGSGGALTINGTNYTLVHSMADIAAINASASTLTGQYALANSIADASSTPNWVPIGTDGNGNLVLNSNGFSGAFEGLGHTINNLTIDNPSSQFVGLFGYTSNATLENLGLTGGSVTGQNYVGGLVGFAASSGRIANVFSTEAVTGNYRTGGLVGDNQATITGSYSTGTITGYSDWTGGLVGFSEGNGSIDQSYSTSTVNGANYAGGLVGANWGQFTTNSYATGAVTGGFRLGGLVADNRSTLSNVYATGSVYSSGSDEIGGLVGHNYSNISNAYATGAVTGNSNVGGLIGINEGTVNTAHATGLVTGRYNYIGGLIGVNYNAVNTVYATGNVSGMNFVGGIAGYSNAAISSAYATGTVSYSSAFGNGGDQFGGLVGRLEGNGSLTNSYYTGTSVAGLTNVGGLAGYMIPGATITNSHYDIDQTAINGASMVTAGGLYDAQFQSWLPSKTLTASAYFGVADANGYYSLSTIQNLKDFLGFAEDSTLKWKLVNDISLASMPGQVIPYFAGTFDGGNFTISDLSIDQLNSDLGLFGYARGATIANLMVTGSVEGLDYVGGVIGAMYNPSSTAIAASNVTSGVNVTSQQYGGTQTGSGFYTGGLAGYFMGSATTVAASGTITGGQQNTGGLIGYSLNGTITDASATGSVTAHGDQTGGLIGRSSTALVNAWASGTVTETNGNWTGGLVGYSDNSITSSWSSSAVYAGGYAGGLVGCNCGGTIDQSYAIGSISGGYRIGGLIGQNSSTLTNSYSTETVTATSDEVGGLIGHNYASVAGSYSTGTVSGQNNVGGFVGYNDGAITTSHSTGNVTAGGSQIGGFAGGSNGAMTTVYATGDVSATTAGSSQVAGLIGHMDGSATLTDSYSAGDVTGTFSLGGMIGYLTNGAQVTNSHYDEGTVLINSAALWSIGGISDSQYTSWINNGRALSPAAYGFTPDSNGVYSIASVQDLINFQGFAETPGLSWKLTNNLDLTSTPGLFTPYFVGTSFDGGGHTISNLALDQFSANLGLFGVVNNANISNLTISGSVTASAWSGGVTAENFIGGLAGIFYTTSGNTISNVTSSVAVSGNSQIGGLAGWSNGGITNATVSGAVTGFSDAVGGLIGNMAGGSITQSSTSGTVIGVNYTGGLVGLAQNSTIDLSFATSNVTGSSRVGGLVGQNQGTITNSYSSGGTVTGNSDGVGGFVGWDYGSIGSGQYSTATVINTGNYTGGFVGIAQGGALNDVWATGAVTGNSRVGGLVGQNQSTITDSYTTGATVTGSSDGVGGFVGWDYGTIGSGQYSTATVINTGNYTGGFVGVEQGNGLANVWATGNVTGSSRTGGLVGYSDGAISNSYATGNVTGTNDGTGGFVGQHSSNSINNSYATGTVTGANYTGGFAGLQYGQENQNYATGAVTGNSSVGGYAGQSQGTTTNSYATGAVYGTSNLVGGFVGYEYYATMTGNFATGSVKSLGNEVGGFAGRIEGGNVTSDFATGAVVGVNQVGGFAGWLLNENNTANVYAMGSVTGNDQVGGLAGYMQNATLTNAFAIGNVTASTGNVGGLVGSVDNINDTVTNGIWNTQTTGQTAGVGPSNGIYSGSYAGVTGETTSQLIGALPTGFDTSAWATGTGLYPYLTAIFSTPAQSISGYAYTSAGNAAVGGQVGLYKSGALLGYGTASVGADGSYYQLVAGGAVTTTSGIGTTLTPSGDTAISARIYSDQRTLTSGNVVLPNITSGEDSLTTSAASLSVLDANLASTFGSLVETAIETSLTADPLSILSTASGGFTIDTALSQTGGIQIQTVGAMTFGTGGSLSSAASSDAVVLAVNGAFVNNAGTAPISTANGRWLIYTQATGSSGAAATGNVFTGLTGLSYYGDAYNFTTGTFASTANSGNRFVYGYQPTLTVMAATQSLVYSGQTQSDSYSVGGLLNGDTQAQALAGTATGLTTSSRHVGDYVLTPGGLNSNDLNYLISYAAGTVSITPASLTITAANQTATYGTAQVLNTAATTGYTVSGLQSSDSITGLTETINIGGTPVSSSATHTDAGAYTITPSAVQGFSTSDYSITYATSGTFTIDPLAVVLTGSQSYNASTAVDIGNLGIANLVAGDSVTIGGAATMASSHVVAGGTEAIASLSGLTLSNSNYTVVGGSGEVTVTPVALTIAAQDQTTNFGTAQALDTSASTGYTVSGLQGSDSITGLTETINIGGTLLTATTATTAAGTYAITPSGVSGISMLDYVITYASTGTLTIVGTSTPPTTPTSPTTTPQQPLVYSVVMPIIGNPVTPYPFIFNNLLSTGTTTQGQDGTPATPGSSEASTSCVAQNQNGIAPGSGPLASVRCSSN
ncbi:filamentous hemagglutinin N-terminal domain-containing protein [Neorhizobium sp. BETTINA12A]|uniref:GLUG motif-containing protein n=1 Tax=Neorhizobium sp. BETTINA12A TaxID=2908924 RepID=UPI001FF43DB4|nr:GLUG motif-containing protein [Neorhizobium sp. BETTINA12A]MCJ9749153.1 filamentous hemagglutinin N-terminal domain-containing protein [Neorhizobium sp. BETTINA12A]